MANTEENRLAMAKYETMTAKRYKEPIDGKYEDAKAATLAGLGSELDADVELSGTSSESESELGQEKAQPIELGTKSAPESDTNGSDGEGTDGSDREGSD